MAKIQRMSDRIKLSIGEVTFTLAPLNFLHKQELAECTKNVGGEEVFDLLKAQVLYIKYALKGIDGVENYDGSKYELQFENDVLTDDCISEILCLEQRNDLTVAAWQILNGIGKIMHPITGEEMENVKLEVISGK